MIYHACRLTHDTSKLRVYWYFINQSSHINDLFSISPSDYFANITHNLNALDKQTNTAVYWYDVLGYFQSNWSSLANTTNISIANMPHDHDVYVGLMSYEWVCCSIKYIEATFVQLSCSTCQDDCKCPIGDLNDQDNDMLNQFIETIKFIESILGDQLTPILINEVYPRLLLLKHYIGYQSIATQASSGLVEDYTRLHDSSNFTNIYHTGSHINKVINTLTLICAIDTASNDDHVLVYLDRLDNTTAIKLMIKYLGYNITHTTSSRKPSVLNSITRSSNNAFITKQFFASDIPLDAYPCDVSKLPNNWQ